MLTISKDADPNYLAEVIVCPELKPHPNADRLQILNVFGGDVIVAKDQYQQGSLLVFFPIESCISQKFLSWANLLDKPEFNADGKTKGFFSSKNGRVRAVRLREISSQGFVYQVSKLAKYYNIPESEFKTGTSFNMVGDDQLVKKYVRNERNAGSQNSSKKLIPTWIEKSIAIFPRPIRKRAYQCVNHFYIQQNAGISKLIVDGHWKFHYKTENAGKMIFTINPEDEIVVSCKQHGTSAIYGNILCHKPFNVFRYVGGKLGLKIKDKEHRFVYSSRSVIKNAKSGKFTDDVWGKIAAEFNGIVPPDITVYGEIVGFSSPNKHIQKGYDYGIKMGDCDFSIYRMTEKTPDGIREMSWGEIEEFARKTLFDTVPVYYKGRAQDMFDIPVDENWRQNFLATLKEKYLDKTCEFCTTGVVNEGVVIRNESKESKPALKYKSPSFLIRESSARDNGEEDMEEES